MLLKRLYIRAERSHLVADDLGVAFVLVFNRYDRCEFIRKRRYEKPLSVVCKINAAVGFPVKMLMYGKVSQENYVELTAASAIPNKEIKSPQILRY